MSGVIVVGIDGSEGAQRALRWAAEEARVRDATLRVVLVWSYMDQPTTAGFDPSYGEEDARRALAGEVAKLGDRAEGIDIEQLPVCDLPVRGLLDAAADADLLVVGSRGLGGFKELLLGSVSTQVVHHAHGPVVIVPGEERKPR